MGKLICGLALAGAIAGVTYLNSKVVYRCTRTTPKVTFGQPLGKKTT